MKIPSPLHLSTGARAYLESPDVLDYPEDWTDAWAVQEFRDLTNVLWAEPNSEITVNFTATHDSIGGVTVERINSGAPSQGAQSFDDAGPVVLHFHGGMFCLGTPEIDRPLNAAITHQTGAEVISVDYRLAPEHRFPAALDDALAVYRTLSEQGRRIALVGESAGGGLAASCALAVRDCELPDAAALAMISPMLDLTGGSDTYRTLTEADPDYGDTSALLRPAMAYAGDTPLDDPLVSPLFADLAGLPPTLIQVGNREVLLGDSSRFTRKARSAGVSVQFEVQDAGWHNYPIWQGVAEADTATASLSDFLRGWLA